MIVRMAILAALMLCAAPAMAECGTNGCFDVRITKLYPQTQGDVLIETDGNATLLGCTPAAGSYITLKISAPDSPYFGQQQAVYALVLSSFLQNRVVSLRTANSSVGCTVDYVTVSAN